MIIEKRIISQISTSDTSIMYSSDQMSALIDLLRKKYSNKCYKECFIIDIVRIVNKSPLISEWNRSGGYCRINVDFIARGVIYDKNEIIPDAKIVEIMDNGVFILNSQYAAMSMAPHSKLQNYKIGQSTPVRVNKARYIPYKDKITASVLPMIPIINEFDEKEYIINISEDDAKSLSLIDNQIRNLLTDKIAKYSKQEKKKYETLKDILNPYAKKQSPKKGFVEKNITDIKAGVVYRPMWLNPDSVTCLYNETVDESQIVNNGVSILKGYLNSILKHITLLTELVEMYEVDQSTKHIWQLYISEKL